ncbi:receptor-like protein 7 [Eucalyptus grandis]|uniref:receptor-like protein 7 n=1 Tax=Eucalyptus grandis TaxID=71139 RepID=UPI00192EB269|nr:receptor-like protein 7 [Eucalyptus grandis]
MAALSLYLLLTWIFLLSLFRTRFAEVLCHADESSALMEFKRSFRTNTTDWRCIHPKVHSWSLDGSGDCCSWDGIKCDEVTGRVIALNLSSSCLSGTMSPNTTLFRLVHMESLNLAFNSFNFSSIPYGFGNLSKLQYLNLSSSDFSGEIPHDISQLSKLVSLDLSSSSSETLRMPNMGGFVHNLTGLKELDLSLVSLSSPFPPMLANFSSLTLLRLASCELSGNFLVSIFQLPNLEVLSIADNSDLSGFFPEPHWGSPLKSLYLSRTNFSGEIPSSIGNLSLLNELRAENCYFSGSLPSSMGNLSHLTILDFYANNLQGQIPVSFANLTQLLELQLSNNNLQGPVPVSFANLTQLLELYLFDNNLSGDFLEWVVNLTKLTSLDISGNQLSGGFPSSFENLKQLTHLGLSGNDLHGDILGALWNLKDLKSLFLESLNLNGVLDANDLFTLKNLTKLVLSNNNISFTKSFINATTSKLAYLYLDSCNLTEFPRFIGYLSELEMLFLQHNRIQGMIPRWMWNNSKESLRYVDLSHNLLTGFENNQTNLPLPNLNILDISSNLLKTTLPVPPPLVMVYNISNNFLFGEVPTSICEVSYLTVLDLSNNTLNGTLPPCLGSIHPLILLNLARNKFDGMIPHIYLDDCALRLIDLRENQLSGIVPKSLGNCRMLEYLNLGDNQINDTFPFWLSELTYLKVIGLRSNNFHGPIESNLSQLNFTSLHILDISNNSFNGEFPSNLLKSCHAMKVMVGQDKLAYLDIETFPNASFSISMTYAMKLMNKGMKKEYAKIPYVLIAIDLSNNKFEGFIPELIGDLESLRMLNLSNNLLNGSIPPSLANLTVLEALDLSQNNLVGEIPQQLARLTFLSVFNISHNRLSGPIPHGTQFDTFESSSFAMNNGLCGSPLPNKCTNGEDAPAPPSSFKVDDEEECVFNLDWRIVLVGVGVGFSVGIVIENLIIDDKRMWFLCCSKKMAKGWKKVRKALADKKLCS